MTEPSTAPAPPYPTDFLDASPEELARRDPSRTAAEWAEAQAHTRAVWEAPAAPPPVVDREEDVPALATEGEEADFWEEHQMGPELERRYRSRRPPAPPKQPAPTSLRLEADTVAPPARPGGEEGHEVPDAAQAVRGRAAVRGGAPRGPPGAGGP